MNDTQAGQKNTSRFERGEMARSASRVQLLVFKFLQVADSVQDCQIRQSRQPPGGTGAWSVARVSGSADRWMGNVPRGKPMVRHCAGGRRADGARPRHLGPGAALSLVSPPKIARSPNARGARAVVPHSAPPELVAW